MKKVIFALAVATVFAACNNTGSTTATSSTDSTAVDSVKVDSVKVDTVKAK